jgi:hypothetical protein
MIKIHYAVQTCDIASNQNQSRYCGYNKTAITIKCISSFLSSVIYLQKSITEVDQYIKIIDDGSSEQVTEFLRRIEKTINFERINLSIDFLSNQGISNSIRSCYTWLEKNGVDLVYQIQDDYLYTETALLESVEMFFGILKETNTHAIVSPYNDPWYWSVGYRNKSTARAVFLGTKRYWIQIYDISCTFLTSKLQFSKHWDLYEKFFHLIDIKEPKLEGNSINKILSERGVLGITPVESIALHMQSEFEKDPYIDWQARWNNVKDY